MSILTLFTDWSAKTFLGFYACYFLFCLAFLLLVRGLTKRKWGRGIESATPLSVYDLAMLAGGPMRMAHLTLLRLLEREVVTVSKNSFGSDRAKLLDPSYAGANHFEKRWLTQLAEKKGKGVSLAKLTAATLPLTQHTEEQLAVRGLSATKGELKSLKHKLRMFPLLFLIPGAVRVALGIQRDEYFFFALSMAILGSFILLLLSQPNSLTSRGKKELKEARKAQLAPTNKHSNQAFASFAVLGWVGISGSALATQIGPDSCSYLQTHGNPANSSPSGGCGGGGSGCGGGGCGGGCGGCGG